ncbi:DUF2782 domain-containing protein [Salinicola halimionae]|uniref:DUF2782 domain-containing protein n=1 Tax=Salinicola halimionae TaxID=1949081 RepID=UPI000DA1BBF3|nr:DUF2782 domain-containing protein [Salinicola halimionae]
MTMWLPALLAALLIGGVSLPAMAQSAVQPEITSQKDAQRTIDEYRVNGKLYAIRIAPRHLKSSGKNSNEDGGETYFFYDDSGDGDFKRVEASSVPVPDWVQNE